MVDVFVLADNVAFVVAALGELVAGVFKRCYHRPAVRIEIHLMHTYLMTLTAVVKSRMIEQIPLPVIIPQNGVVTAGHVRTVEGGKLVVAHDLQTNRIKVGVGIQDSLIAGRIHEGTER